VNRFQIVWQAAPGWGNHSLIVVGYSFAIKETPGHPEPSTWALLAMGAGAWSADRVPSYRAGIVAAWSKDPESIRRAMLALIG
jgi:hypothetical protein